MVNMITVLARRVASPPQHKQHHSMSLQTLRRSHPLQAADIPRALTAQMVLNLNPHNYQNKHPRLQNFMVGQVVHKLLDAVGNGSGKAPGHWLDWTDVGSWGLVGNSRPVFVCGSLWLPGSLAPHFK